MNDLNDFIINIKQTNFYFFCKMSEEFTRMILLLKKNNKLYNKVIEMPHTDSF